MGVCEGVFFLGLGVCVFFGVLGGWVFERVGVFWGGVVAGIVCECLCFGVGVGGWGRLIFILYLYLLFIYIL